MVKLKKKKKKQAKYGKGGEIHMLFKKKTWQIIH